MLGTQFQSHLVGSGSSSLYHVPNPTNLNNILKTETGIDDTTEAGVFLEKMIEEAVKIFKGLPTIIQHDERKVPTLSVIIFGSTNRALFYFSFKSK